MRIFVAGLETETNTFSPIPTRLEDYHLTYRQDLDDQLEPLASTPPFEQWVTKAKDAGAELIFSLYGWAQPAAPTEQSAYEVIRDNILSDLESAGDIDIVLLFLHGAMVSEQCEDCEADLMSLIRDRSGPNTVIAAELDLHAQLSPAMVDIADLLITYKEYPHIDVAARGEELFDLAVKTWRGEIKPAMAYADCNMMGIYPTTSSPLREFVDSLTETEQLPLVLSVSFIHSFTYGDLPNAGAKVLAVTDNDAQLAVEVASTLSEKVYKLRKEIVVHSLPLEDAFKKALSAKSQRPIVLADQSDNAGGGAPADSTFALQWLLDHNIRNVAIAIFFDPAVVLQAIRVGEGGTLRCSLGGHHGKVSGEPVTDDFTVIAIRKSYQHQFPQEDAGPQWMPIGDTVSLSCHGIELVVSSARCQCFCPSIFHDLGINLLEKDVLVVKSTQHFYNAFAPIASQIIYMSAAGAVPPDVTHIDYKKMATHNKFPWVEDPRSAEPVNVYIKESYQ